MKSKIINYLIATAFLLNPFCEVFAANKQIKPQLSEISTSNKVNLDDSYKKALEDLLKQPLEKYHSGKVESNDVLTQKVDGNTEKVVLENEGDTNLGIIYYIRQFHEAPNMNEDDRISIAKYQYEMLKTLSNLGIKDVFAEDDIKEFTIRPDDEIYRGLCNVFKSFFFKDGIPDTPNPDQLEILKDYGAANVYAMLNDDVNLHETLPSREERMRIKREIENGVNPDYNIFILRENYTIDYIKNFLSKNPGKKVALIYGTMHEFFDNLDESFNPRLYSIYYPKMDPNATNSNIIKHKIDYCNSIYDSNEQEAKDCTNKVFNHIEGIVGQQNIEIPNIEINPEAEKKEIKIILDELDKLDRK